MALVFGIVVTNELLLTGGQLYPVAVLNGSGITGTVLLLLHLNIELLLVNGKTVFTTDELGEVERESVGVEQTEGLHAIQFGLALSLEGVHSVVQHADTLFEGAEERLFLFLNYLGDKLLLGLQLGEGTAHLGNECWNKLVQETILLIQEGIGITYGTAQDTTDNITCLGIRRQLTVGDREGNGTQVVGANTHGHVDVVLLLADRTLGLLLEGEVLQSGNLLLGLDDRLEYVGIVVRVLALHHADQTLKAHTGINYVH